MWCEGSGVVCGWQPALEVVLFESLIATGFAQAAASRCSPQGHLVRSQQLSTARKAAGGRCFCFVTSFVDILQDRKSFLHVPAWSNNDTSLLAVTLVRAPCAVAYDARLGTADWAPPAGCGLLAADNSTLVPVLLRNASIPTSEPLLIRITSNVTLGHGLKGSIHIRRPVILLGLASVVTSMDMGMVVNQVNVTGPNGTLVWQALVLENLAPGGLDGGGRWQWWAMAVVVLF